MPQQDASIGTVLNPDNDWSGSFSTSAAMLRPPHPKGVDAIEALAETVCPYGCPNEFSEENGGRRDTLIWIASRGLGQNLHFDSNANLFFHLYGSKQVIIAPPDEIIRRAHLLPVNHPAERQTQLLWDGEDPDRKLKGYSSDVGDDTDRPAPTYNQTREQIAFLEPGDLLYMPAFWGHQTFSELGGPTVSLATWIFPAGGDPLSRLTKGEMPEKDRGNKGRAAVASAANGASALKRLMVKKDGYSKWGAVKFMLYSLAAEIFAGDAENLSAGKAIIQEWHDQRWRPQFGGLGIDPNVALPEDLCRHVKWDAGEFTAPIITAMNEEVSWYALDSVTREAVLFQILGDYMDWFIADARTRMMKDELPKLEGLKGDGAAQIGMILGSMVNCP